MESIRRKCQRAEVWVRSLPISHCHGTVFSSLLEGVVAVRTIGATAQDPELFGKVLVRHER